MFLPVYGLVGAIAYLLQMPFQRWLYNRNKHWLLTHELIFFGIFILFGGIIARLVYLNLIVPNEPNPYTLTYFIGSLYLPAMLTILPIVVAGRWAFGKYKNKKMEDQKIEIEGEGTYEGLRLLWNDLISVKADDNYIEVSFLDGAVLKKQLIRNKLSVISEAFPELLRTHRSFLINPYHFRQWKTQGGKPFMTLSNGIEIPVSKTYTQQAKDRLQLATK